jgi:hypothetical protein
LSSRLYEVPSGEKILVYCKSGSRSVTACNILVKEPVYPPKINSYSPTNTSESVVGNVQKFSLSTTDNCEITWYVNGVEVKTEVDVSYSAYEKSAGSAGTSTIKVVAENNNGADSKEWEWIISPVNVPNFVASYDYNNNFKIDAVEISTAIDDYLIGNLPAVELSELIDYYLSGESYF